MAGLPPTSTNTQTATGIPPVVIDATAKDAANAKSAETTQGQPQGDHVVRSSSNGVQRMFTELCSHGHHHHPPKGDTGAKKSSSSSTPKASAADLKKFDAKAKAIKNHAAYKALPAADRAVADQILTTARTKPNPNYYADKLKLLFDTPDAPPTTVESSNNSQVSSSVKASEIRMKTPEAKKNVDKEEKLSADASRTWTKLQGDGAKYYVDRSDPKNVVVKMKVHLTGDAKAVADTKKLEDDIEKQAATHGYTLDIEFVNSGGDDVFTVGADPKKWTTSANWVGSTYDIAHEAHHLLKLDDRYDYIESHADNAEMKMGTRLHWFNVQIKKPFDPNGKHSLMGHGSKPLHDDVCNVIQAPDMGKCVSDRKKAHGGR